MTPIRDHQAFLLTPPGAGAIAVIRVTGIQPALVVARIFRPNNETTLTDAIGHRLLFGRLVDGDEVIDDALVSLASRSAEEREMESGPAVDISCHGGVRVVERILLALESLGVTVQHDAKSKSPPWPAHSRIEREAIEAALISKTERAVQFAAGMRADLVRRLDELVNRLQANPNSAREELESLVEGYTAANILLNGATVALIGPPNSGKSTLFNRLVGRLSVVTSPTPGTTRDWVAEDIEIEGVPITLVDTAGRHPSAGELERVAVDGGIARAQSAGAILIVLDGSHQLGKLERNLLRESVSAVPRIMVATKSDLSSNWGQQELEELQLSVASEFVRVSALTGRGCDDLIEAIPRALGFSRLNDTTVCFFTNRQVTLAREALFSSDPVSAGTIIAKELIGR